ncbi:MAG: hypothetical protein AB8I08_22640 [Sandaracinaceae bacterium]
MSAPDPESRSELQGEPLPPSWFERNVEGIQRGVLVICVLLLVGDLVFHFVGHKHVHFDIEAWPGFYAIVGFVSYVSLVLTAKQLRKLLKRPVDYYDHPAPPLAQMDDAAAPTHEASDEDAS